MSSAVRSATSGAALYTPYASERVGIAPRLTTDACFATTNTTRLRRPSGLHWQNIVYLIHIIRSTSSKFNRTGWGYICRTCINSGKSFTGIHLCGALHVQHGAFVVVGYVQAMDWPTCRPARMPNQ